MFVPRHYRVDDPALIDAFIRKNGFATVISQGTDYPLATHLPVELEVNGRGEKVLWSHMARSNPQWKQFAEHPKVLVSFLSPIHRYISSSWYDFPEAPTWNYMSVQVSGDVTLLSEEDTWEQVRRLVRKYEADSEHPVDLDRLPPDVQKQMSGLVAFEIRIAKTEAAFKLSQNRDDANFDSILRHLRDSADPMAIELARVMEQTRRSER